MEVHAASTNTAFPCPVTNRFALPDEVPAWLTILSPVDWLVILFISLWMLKGALKGLPDEMGRLLVLFVFLFAGWPLFGFMRNWLQDVQPGLQNRAAGELLCFVVCVLIVYLAARILRTTASAIISKAFTGWFVRLGGAVIAGIRALLIYAAVLLSIQVSNLQDVKDMTITHSRIGQHVAPPLPSVYGKLRRVLPFLPNLPSVDTDAADSRTSSL